MGIKKDRATAFCKVPSKKLMMLPESIPRKRRRISQGRRRFAALKALV